MAAGETNIVGAYEAKTHFSELLERAAGGEEITITRHGQPVARLVPIRTTGTPASRLAAINEMRELAAKTHLGGLNVKELIAEGRR